MQIALDDVGSGYSSLKRLRELPVDCIKLDQAFVRGVLEKPDDLQFVASMVSLALGLRKKLVVEGVENPEFANALRVLGAGLAQGYGSRGRCRRRLCSPGLPPIRRPGAAGSPPACSAHMPPTWSSSRPATC